MNLPPRAQDARSRWDCSARSPRWRWSSGTSHASDYASKVAASWRFTDRHIAPRARQRDILCFSDSHLQFGVLPKILAERTGRRAYSFAIHSGPAPASYFPALILARDAGVVF